MESSVDIAPPDNQSELPEYIGSLIHDGFYDKLVIIGFPYDIGATKAGAKRGQDYGPDSFRRFVKTIGAIRNPEYAIDISQQLPSIADYGNIQIAPANGKPPTQRELQEKLATKVGLCIQRQKALFVIGGTRDMMCAMSNAMVKESKEGQRSLFILFRRSLDLDEVKVNAISQEQEVHQKNSLRQALADDSFRTHHKVIVVGPNQVDQANREALAQLNPSSELITSEDLKQWKPLDAERGCLTSVGQWLEKTVATTEYDKVYISISMESIMGCTGVSTKCMEGISTEEAIDVCMTAAKLREKVVAFDVSDYNPFIEDWSTGRLVATMFYYFALGLTLSLQQQSQQ